MYAFNIINNSNESLDLSQFERPLLYKDKNKRQLLQMMLIFSIIEQMQFLYNESRRERRWHRGNGFEFFIIPLHSSVFSVTPSPSIFISASRLSGYNIILMQASGVGVLKQNESADF
jgi:hypothetical protein